MLYSWVNWEAMRLCIRRGERAIGPRWGALCLLFSLWCAFWIWGAPTWANAQNPTLTQPRPVHTPIKVVQEGTIYSDVIAIWGKGWQVEQVTFTPVTLPQGMLLTPIGRQGCCHWSARLSWLPDQSHVGKSFEIKVSYSASDGNKGEIKHELTVVDKNALPRISSQPPAQVKQGELFSYELKATDEDQQTLSYRLLEGPAGMMMDALGKLTWRPAPEQVGTHTVSCEVADDAGGVVVQSFLLQVLAVQQAPVFRSTPLESAVVGQPYLYKLAALDPNKGDTFSFQLKSGPTGMKLLAPNQLSWTPTQSGTFAVTAEVIDNNNQTSTQSWNIKVTAAGANNPPVWGALPLTSLKEGQSWSYKATATDADKDTLSWALVEGPTNASTKASPGALTIDWTPGPNDAGQHHIELRVDDGKGAVVRRRFAIVVLPVNDPPVILSVPPLQAVQGQPLWYQVVASDPDPGSVLRYNLTRVPTGAKVQLDEVTGLLYWKPTQSEVGKQELELEVSDQFGARVTQRLSIQVHDGNDAPVISSTPPTTVVEGSEFRYQITATDEDGANEVLRYRWITHLPTMSLDLEKGLITWTPTNEEVGQHTVAVEVYDQKGGRTVQRFTLSVTNLNNPPVLRSSPVTTAMVGRPYVYQIQAFDPDIDDRDSLTYTLLDKPDNLDLDRFGRITWTPNESQGKNGANVHKVKVLIRDASLGELKHEFEIRVFTNNQLPRVEPLKTQQIAAGLPFSTRLKASDPDNDPLAYVLEQGPDGLTLDPKTGLIQWLPHHWQLGTWRVLVRVEDGRGGHVVVALSIEVSKKNADPLIQTEPPLQAFVDVPYSYAPRATQWGAVEVAEWSLQSAPKGMTIDAQTGLIQWTPQPDQAGPSKVSVTVSLKPKEPQKVTGGTSTQTFWIWTTQRNRPPTSQGPPTALQATQGALYEVQLAASDPDPGDQLHFVLLEGPPGVTLHPLTGLLQWTPSLTQKGSFDLRVKASDKVGAFVEIKWQVEVKSTNRPPMIITAPIVYASVGQPYKYVARIVDPDKNPVSAQLLAQPPSFQTNDRMLLDQTGLPSQVVLNWTPGPKHANQGYLISLLCKDSLNGETVQRFVLHVLPAGNKAPTWKSAPPSGTKSATQGASYVLQLNASDPDGDTLRYRLLVSPRGMQISPQSGAISWTPDPLQVGTHEVLVRVEDGRGGVLQAGWLLQVTNTNDPPRLISIPATRVRQGETFVYKLRAEDPDLGVDPQETLGFLLQFAPSGLNIDPQTMEMRWTPGAKDVGTHVVQVSVTDRLRAKDSQLFRITVLPRLVPPSITSTPVLRAFEKQRYRYQVTVDSASRQLSFQLLKGPASMHIDASAGLIEWIPSNDDAVRKQVQVQVQVTDEEGYSDVQSFQIDVTDHNDPPRFVSTPCTEAGVGNYVCVLFVEDIDSNATLPTIAKLMGPGGLKVEVGSAFFNRRLTVSLKWTTTPADIGSHIVLLEASDGRLRDRLQFEIVVRSNEGAPVANAGVDQVLAPGEVILDGSESVDAQGKKTGLAFEWSRQEGPAEVQLPTPNSPKNRLVLRASGVYIFQLVVTKDGKASPPAKVRITISNVAPIARLRAPYGAQVDRVVTLDGSASEDVNGDALRYRWLQTSGPEVKLNLTDPVKATFQPKKPGLYVFSLTVEEDLPSPPRLSSKPVKVEIAVHDPAEGEYGVYIPHAVIIAPKVGLVGTPIPLDGARSRGLTSERLKTGLQYEWQLLSGPSGATLSTPQSQQTNFEAVSRGLYTVGLVVKNNLHTSKMAVWTLFLQEEAQAATFPVAIPQALYVLFEQTSALDGTASVAEPGKELMYSWSQIDGTPTTLDTTKPASPTFFPMSRAAYSFRLSVQVDRLVSQPADVTVLVNQKGNEPPLANAGEDRKGKTSAFAGQGVTLDGSKSKDPDPTPGTSLQYRWRQVDGFPVALNDSTTATPSFVPITYGILTFSLEVFDGKTWSFPSLVKVVVHNKDNHVPLANAGPDQKVLLGQSVTLDGSASSDDDEDTLTYQWRLLSPSRQDLLLNQLDPKYPSFTAKDRSINRYVFGLVVDDGKARSLEDTVVIQVLDANKPPVAVLDEIGAVFTNEEFTLDGSKSYDPDNDTISFSWKQVSGEVVTLQDTKSKQLTLRLTKPGEYVFQLQVFDQYAYSRPKRVTVQVKERPNEGNGCGCQSQGGEVPPSFLFWLLVVGLILYRTRRSQMKGVSGRM